MNGDKLVPTDPPYYDNIGYADLSDFFYVGLRRALSLVFSNLFGTLAVPKAEELVATPYRHGNKENAGRNLSKAKKTSVSGLVEAGIALSKSGKVRLLKLAELDKHWDPAKDPRLTTREITSHLIRVLETGETAASELVAKLGTKAEPSRELAYRLYTTCERKKRAQEALAYNTLVQSWPEITRLAQTVRPANLTQGDLH